MTTVAPPDSRDDTARVQIHTPVSWVPSLMMIVMVVAGELEYRRRDVTAALEASVDLAIAIELAAYLAVASVLFLGAVAPRGRGLPATIGPMWALVAVLAVSALWAPSVPLASVRAGQLLVVAALATTLSRRADARDFAALAFSYVVLVTGFIILGLVWRIAPSNQVAGRFNWAATHPVVAASLLVVSLLILVAWTRNDSGPRYLPAPAVVLLLVVHGGALLATQTRGAIFAAVIGFLVWVFLEFDRRRDIAIVTALLSPVVVVLSRDVFDSFLLRGESVEQLRTLNSRTDLWAEAWTLVVERPWFGWGYFSARELFLDTIGLGGAHNAYIEVLVSAGLLGGAVLLFAIVRLILNLRRSADHPQRSLVGALLAALLANGLTVQYWAQGGTGTSVWMFLLFAWAAVITRESVEDRAPVLRW